MKKKILIVGISIIGLVSILPLIKKDKLMKENIFNNYNTELAVNISEDGTNYNIVNEVPTTGYELNSEKSICKTQNETSGIENAPKDNNITIEYKEGKINFLGVTKQRTRCYLYFDKQKTASETILDNITIKPGTPNFVKIATLDEGVYSVNDSVYGGTSYYWRGAVRNNYVNFARFCWRIVRINGDGSIRLIYDGTTCHANGTSTAESIAVASTTYNTSYNQSNYVGWTYEGTSQRTLSGTASNAKTQLESWYNSNIGNNSAYSTKVADGRFCNDRNVGQPVSGDIGYATTWSLNGTKFRYAVAKRLYNDYAPTLACNSGDVYTLKVGLITADEVEFAGGRNANNSSYYLYNGQNYWTMSPSDWNGTRVWAFYVDNYGFLTWASVSYTYDIRPVINLRSDVTFSGGNGTLDNPYVVQ